jgi:predicted transcriptional regulator
MCDGSGALILRKPVEGFALPRHGSACPLWPLYTALSRPAQPVMAVVEMPGLAARRFAVQAFCAASYPLGFDGPQVRDAAMLIRPQRGGEAGLPVGSSCRICPRGACPARREPAIISTTA